jgi:hypothetical protein
MCIAGFHSLPDSVAGRLLNFLSLTGSGAAFAGSGAAFTGSGAAFAGSGAAFAGSGAAFAGSGAASALATLAATCDILIRHLSVFHPIISNALHTIKGSVSNISRSPYNPTTSIHRRTK